MVIQSSTSLTRFLESIVDMIRSMTIGTLVVVWSLFSSVAAAQDQKPTESDYYEIESLPLPAGVVLEVGGLELLPDDVLAASSRRGDIYLFENARSAELSKVRHHRFASGLHEVLGLAWRDGWLYATQRGEVSRLQDRDGHHRADVVETVSDPWEIGGDYHEYAFGSQFDRDGNIWVALCLTGSFTSDFKFRGWCLRISPDGTVTPTCSGLRSPGGIGMNCDGDMFFTENQGPWNGACSLKHLKPGAFVGNPAGNRWYEITDAMGPRPREPVSGSRMMTEAKQIPELVPPAVYFPYPKMGQSASGIVCDATNGKFGPFAGQMFVGDQAHSTVMRVDLEQVRGNYQGACFPFRSGFGSGNLAMLLSEDGTMFVGGTNRGWGSRGSRPFALERMKWTGKVPFEILTMRARSDGFVFTTTMPVDRESATDPRSYRVETYTYIYQSGYGSPEVDQTHPKIENIQLSDDRKTIRITLDALQEGHVHEFHLDGLRSDEQLPLLHSNAYYTLNYIPEG